MANPRGDLRISSITALTINGCGTGPRFGPIAAEPAKNRGIFVNFIKQRLTRPLTPALKGEGGPPSLRRDKVLRLPVHRHVAVLGLDPPEPAAQRRIAGEVVVAFAGDVRV